MNEQNELAKAKWLIVSGILFIISCFFMYAELAYLISGREATATVTQAYETTIRGRFGISRGTQIVAEYTFAEPDGTRRSDPATMSSNWIPTPQLTVRYTPGANGRSRIAGEVNWLWITIFGVSLILMAVFGIRIWNQYKEGERPRSSGRER